MEIRRKITAFIALGILASCANIGTPSGGDKDETPPVITKTTPENYSTEFDKKKIIIDFDEFVKIQDASKNVIISPPQKKSPKVRLRERKIEIQLRDGLRPNTTYTIDFGSAIVDNNEGNPLGEYRYIFTTGNSIDSMGLAGFVKGAAVDSVVKTAKVAIFAQSDTLNPYRKLPDYISQTDSMGFFMFTNISDKAYNIIAFQDINNNNMLDGNEPLAFQNEPVHTSVPADVEEDSLQFDKHTLFKNVNLQLHLFPPIPKKQYLKDYKRTLPSQFTLLFNAPLKDSLDIELLDVKENPNFFVEMNEKRDSLVYWILNKDLQKKDTLFAKLNYLRTDSLGVLQPYLDTLKLKYKAPKKKKDKKDKDGKPELDYMKVKTNFSGKINYFDALTLTFERPVLDLKKEDIHIFTQKDSVENPQKFTLEKDSLLLYQKFYVKMPLEAGSIKYKMRIDSMKIHDISGRPNEKLETSFQTQEESYYGKLFVTVIGGNDNLLLQVVKKQKPNEVITQQRYPKNGQFVFENLPPATYQLKALWDRNRNGKWDTGDYEERRLPELGRFFKKDIELQSNWELEISWDLNKK